MNRKTLCIGLSLWGCSMLDKQPKAWWLRLGSFVLGLMLSCHALGQTKPVWAGRFETPSATVPAPWRMVTFPKLTPTAYRVVMWDGVMGMEARADASMSLMGRSIEVDLSQTPVLCWRWRVDRLISKADMRQKSGDDYAARVYVAFSLPASSMSFATRAKLKLARTLYGDVVPDGAINYVWDKLPVGTWLPNAYTDRTQMKVQRSGAAQLGTWVTERVNVAQDALSVFGPLSVQDLRLNLLAVATDTDNTGESAVAGFADLHFVAAAAPCEFPSTTP